MQNLKKLAIILGLGIVTLGLLLLIGGILLSHFLIDLWWFNSLDFGGYFWLKLLYRYILSGLVTLFFFTIFFLNFWIASGFLGFQPGRRTQKSIIHKFQTGAMEVYTPLSLILAVMIAVPFYELWQMGLLYFFGPAAHVDDPVYGLDVSFYLFDLPIYLMIQRGLLITFAILFVATALLYWVEHKIIPERKQVFPTGARIHLTIQAILTVLIIGWGFMLQRFDLLYVNRHEPVFFGPGFVEIRYYLPLIWLALFTFLGAAFSAIFYVHKRKGLWVGLAFFIFFMIVEGLRYLEIIPAFLEQYIVKANPVTTEGVFMRNNVEATLHGYDLDDVATVDFQVSLRPEEDIGESAQDYITNIPVWDENFLHDVYQQLQGLRPYYRFSPVDVARYTIQGRVQQVNLAAREINLTNLPREAAETWENQHLRYTHGFGES